MLLPIGDEPNDPQTTAWMNHALIGVNVLVFAVLLFQPRGGVESLLARWAYAPRDPSALTLLTSMFLHGSFLHLLGNMLFLWMFGDNIEARLGPWLHLAAYLVVGSAGTLAHGLWADLPVIGASGAVSGVLGMYFVACGRHRVRLLLWLYFFITVLHLNARLVVLFWFVLQDVIPTLMQLRGGETDSVAHMAHLGGFAAGVLLMLALKRRLGRIDRADAREWAHAALTAPRGASEPPGAHPCGKEEDAEK